MIMENMTDILNLEDVKKLVDAFYGKVRENNLLAPVFNERIKDRWPEHLEKMYTFWNAALFGVKGYMGNPFAKHATMPVDARHFERWLSLFNETVDACFAGPVAEEAKSRGQIMAATFQRRIQESKGKDTYTLV